MSKSLSKPACVNCKHHTMIGKEHFCALPVWDLVLGKWVDCKRPCYDMRVYDPRSECGKLAAKFEAKE